MCLEKVNFNLKYNEEEKDYVGIGYKVVDYSYIRRYGLNEWYLSNFSRYLKPKKNGQKIKQSNIIKIQDDEKKEYHPGFHIFTNINSAKSYSINSTNYNLIIEVSYKKILAYGQEFIYDDFCRPKKVKKRLNTVIANEMKINKILLYRPVCNENKWKKVINNKVEY